MRLDLMHLEKLKIHTCRVTDRALRIHRLELTWENQSERIFTSTDYVLN